MGLRKPPKSPYGQSPESLPKKEAVAQPEESDEIDLSAGFGGATEDELALLGSISDQPLAPQQAPVQQARPAFERFWTLPVQGEAQPTVEQSMQELKGFGAELAGGLAAQGAGAATGAAIGSVVPVIGTGIGAAIGGFLGGAALTKPSVNQFREFFGLEAEEDRSQLLDALFSIPALAGVRATKSVAASALKTEAGVNALLAKTLNEEQKAVWNTMRSGLEEAANQVGGEQFAKTLKQETIDDVAEFLKSGLSPPDSIKEATKRAAAKLDASRQFDDLANVFGPQVSSEDLVKLSKGQATPTTSPGAVLNQLTKQYTNEWKSAVSGISNDAVALGKIEKIDLQPVLDDLKAMKENRAFGRKYSRQIDEAIRDIENSKAIEKSGIYKNISPEEASRIVVKDLETGKGKSLNDLLNPEVRYETSPAQLGFAGEGKGAVPQLGGGGAYSTEKQLLKAAEEQPGLEIKQSVRVPSASFEQLPLPGARGGSEFPFAVTPEAKFSTEVIPEVSRNRLVGQPELYAEGAKARPGLIGQQAAYEGAEIQGAIPLNQKFAQQKLIALDKLINLRQLYDESPIMKGAFTSEKKAQADVVKNLRNIEDTALAAMAESSDPGISELGKRAMASKGRVATHLADMSKLGKMKREDIIKYASAIEGKSPEAQGAFRRTLSDYPETRMAVMSEVLNNKLSQITKRGPVGLSESKVDAILNLSNDPKFLSMAEILADDVVNPKEVSRKLKSYADVLTRAQKIKNQQVSNDVTAKATADAAAFFAGRGIGINPMTWVGILAPDNNELAKKIVQQVFSADMESASRAAVTTPGETALSIRYIESLLGKRADPIISNILRQAEERGMQSAVLAPMRAGQSTMAPQEGIQ